MGPDDEKLVEDLIRIARAAPPAIDLRPIEQLLEYDAVGLPANNEFHS
jgi:hypothetical protein